ncbi:MAG: hypothetical protein R3236_00050 [Phycisphaeraceae bacterium]|nr:hypothetical protein [Phycisphaeraceae bacterium]
MLFETDFEAMKIGAEPEGWILDGDFAVATFEKQKVLTLPGSPLSTFSALVHPASFEQERLEKLLIESSRSGQISARIHTLRKGRRLYSRFGVGLGGAEGFKLLVAANQGQLQLWHREEKLARLPFDWQSGRWVHVRLAVFPKEAGEWIVQGKAWHGDSEPDQWMIGVRIRQDPPVGRPALWATPYAGKPIHFDDLSVRTYPAGP